MKEQQYLGHKDQYEKDLRSELGKIGHSDFDTIDITMPEVQLFNLTGHNSPSNTIGITWKPTE